MESDTTKTRLIHEALRRKHHSEPGNGLSAPWVYAEEVRVMTGFGSMARYYQTQGLDIPDELLGAGEQRIDAYAVHTWPSKRWWRRAFEVKASTSDCRKELADESKSAAARFLSNEFILVLHEDVKVLTKDIPSEWGVWRYSESTQQLRTVRKATWRDTPLPPFPFMVSFARRLQGRVR